MNYEVAILYAKQRMRELCKLPNEYHFEPIYVCPTAEEEASGNFSISAYNEIYILVNPGNYSGLMIIADNSVFDSDNATNRGVPEFTGRIYFKKIASNWCLQGLEGLVTFVDDVPVVTVKYGFVEFLRVVIY